jgi:hypothetical protein
MGIDLGALIQAGTTAAGGIATGLGERKRLEQQALHQQLADELLKAQTSYYQRRPGGAATKLQHLQDPVTGQIYNYNAETGEVSPAMMAPTPTTPGTAPPGGAGAPAVPTQQPSAKKPAKLGVKPPRPIITTTAQGDVLAVDPTTLGVRQVTGAAKPLSAQERTAGSQQESAEHSVSTMEQIAQRNPAAAKAAVAAIQAGGWGKMGKAYAALRGFTNDPDANTFFTEYKNMLLAVTPTYGGARPTQQLMDLEQQATLPALGTGDFTTAFRHMRNRLNDLRAKARRPSVPEGGAAPPAAPAPINPRFDPRKKP